MVFMRHVLAVFLLAAVSLAPLSAAEDLNRADSGRIAQWVGRILEQAHYKHAIFDENISKTFLKNYLDVLDFTHMVLLQSEVDALNAKYGSVLHKHTLRRDAAPAFEIFDQYLARLTERNQLAQRLIKEPATADFTGDEKFLITRSKAPWPKDEAEAEMLWRQRIKFELLQDRLAFLDKARKKAEERKKSGAKEETPPAYDPAETLKTISKRYDRQLKNMQKLKNDDILQLYLTALSRAYDPHSDYMSASDAAEFDIKSIKLSLTGIGATLQSEDGYTKIVSLVPGMPADLSKQIKTGDRVVAVAQGAGEAVDVVEMPLKDVVQLIRGPRGTEVRLTIIPADSIGGSEKKVVTIIRDEIKLTEQFAKARVIEQPGPDGKTARVGVITLPQFYENCSRDIEKLIERLKKEDVTGIVLDLRRNGGGILEEAVSLTGLFIPKGPVVQVRDKPLPARAQVYPDTNSKVAYEGPVVVLVSRLSASASEIAAGALQDYGRAVVVGDQATHGKGTVQKLLSLKSFVDDDFGPDPGKLKLTVAKFYRVAGTTTQKIGVTPDIILPSRYDYMELGESSLPDALPADGTTPVPFARQDRVTPFLEPLKIASADRVRKSTDFVYLNEDIELLKKQLADRTISLNEATRLKELQEIRDRDEARKKERAARKNNPVKIFDLSLAMVDKDQPLKLSSARTTEALTASNETPLPKEEADEEELDDVTKLDPHLGETVSILTDYIKLLELRKGTASTGAN